MAMMERTCVSCGRTIQIPEELEQFSCIYCGRTMRAQRSGPQAEADEADREFALAHLLDGIREDPKYCVKYFNKKDYEASFSAYKRKREDTVRAMDRYLLALPEQREALLEEFSDRFLADWEAAHPGKGNGNDAFSDKMILAFYEIPSILALDTAWGQDYCRLLERKFVEKYPKNVFHCGTYEDLAAGFQRKKLCFITTAVCAFEGKTDDCAELTAFRAFRDGWMQENGDGDLIAEYYEIAPVLVQMIDYCDDRRTRYESIRRDYLEPCYRALLQKDYPLCRRDYIRMVQALKRDYNLN